MEKEGGKWLPSVIETLDHMAGFGAVQPCSTKEFWLVVAIIQKLLQLGTASGFGMVELHNAQRRLEYYEDYPTLDNISDAFEEAGSEELNYEERRHAFEAAVQKSNF